MSEDTEFEEVLRDIAWRAWGGRNANGKIDNPIYQILKAHQADKEAAISSVLDEAEAIIVKRLGDPSKPNHGVNILLDVCKELEGLKGRKKR